MREGIRDGFGRDAVVFEIDEASILETLEDSFGGGFLGGRVAREESTEVNELQKSDKAW